MSRVGRLPVPVPGGVKCECADGLFKAQGPKGALQHQFTPQVTINIGEDQITIERASDKKEDRAYHGLARALVNNIIQGVTQGFERVLVIEGVGYRASLQGKTLNLQLGYSHPVSMEPPEGVEFTVEGTQTIKVAGIDKQLVGQVAADVRALRKPEPYKGKGIRYSDERIRRKVGKAGGK